MFVLDWNQERPTFELAQSIWHEEIFRPLPITSTSANDLLKELRLTNSNGGAEFALFSVGGDNRLDWFVSRNRFDEIAFFEHLLMSSAFRTSLPSLRSPESVSTFNVKWDWSNSYVLEGELANTLMSGGAYAKFAGSGAEAKVLARRFCEDLFSERYEDVVVFETYRPWSGWFFDVAWDFTWIGVDKRQRTVWVLCVTDTD